jgi:hypothetical protein
VQKLYINIVNLTSKISYSLFFDSKSGAKKGSLFSGFYSKLLCLAYKLSHKDKKSIKSKYKAESYFIKYKQHKIKIIA